jgi:hypothetical protein
MDIHTALDIAKEMRKLYAAAQLYNYDSKKLLQLISEIEQKYQTAADQIDMQMAEAA